MWCVQFWDHDQWDEVANTRRTYKAEAIALADERNQSQSHEEQAAANGHRYRVRKVKEDFK